MSGTAIEGKLGPRLKELVAVSWILKLILLRAKDDPSILGLLKQKILIIVLRMSYV